MNGSLGDTFLIIGLFVGTIVTLSLYMLSNSVLSVAAVPVIPQSFGNCKNERKKALVREGKCPNSLANVMRLQSSNLEKEILVAN